MWVNKILFETLLNDNKRQVEEIAAHREGNAALERLTIDLRAQKAKDDITIDWMRHRVNALEKTNAILLQKAAGVLLPTPEIVPSRPGTMSVPDFQHMPSFEDVGEDEAQRLGLKHDDLGFLEFKEDMRTHG